MRKGIVWFLFFLAACFGMVHGPLASMESESGTGFLVLGDAAPDFSLPDVISGQNVSFSDFSGRKALLVVFLCRHCPYVQHVKAGIAQLSKDYLGKDIGIV